MLSAGPSGCRGSSLGAPLLSNCLCSLPPAFPDTKPYEAPETFGERSAKAPLTQGVPWEKGKGSEVSVMLTVSAAAAKVRAGARPYGAVPGHVHSSAQL